MTSLPIDVINVICGWTAQEDVDWYPQFDVKTEKLRWKVNKYSKKFRALGAKLVSRTCIEIKTNVIFPHDVVRGVGRLFILDRNTHEVQTWYFQMLDTDPSNGATKDFVYYFQGDMARKSNASIKICLALNGDCTIYLNATPIGEVLSLTLNSVPENTFSLLVEPY